MKIGEIYRDRDHDRWHVIADPTRDEGVLAVCSLCPNDYVVESIHQLDWKLIQNADGSTPHPYRVGDVWELEGGGAALVVDVWETGSPLEVNIITVFTAKGKEDHKPSDLLRKVWPTDEEA